MLLRKLSIVKPSQVSQEHRLSGRQRIFRSPGARQPLRQFNVHLLFVCPKVMDEYLVTKDGLYLALETILRILHSSIFVWKKVAHHA